jgi:hypothetical protein
MNLRKAAVVAAAWSVLPVCAAAQRPGAIVGKVFVDTVYKPLDGVEVSLPTLQRTVVTDARGAFRFEGLPAGRYAIRARKIGFAVYEGAVDVDTAKVAERGILLPRLTRLDTVKVVGDAYLPLSFLENRAVGLGHFITRDYLEQQGNRKLADILSLVPGLGVVRGRNDQGWILSKHVVPRLNMSRSNQAGRDMYFPEDYEAASGMKAGCYARVYLDHMLLNAATPAQPVNVNEFITQQIEAVEYYAGPAQTPAMYGRLNTTCGVLVIHTRRSP